MNSANERQEAKRIQKEQEAQQIKKLVAEIKPTISKVPANYGQWDIQKTQKFKEFHALATKKVNSARRKLDDLMQVSRDAFVWYRGGVRHEPL